MWKKNKGKRRESKSEKETDSLASDNNNATGGRVQTCYPFLRAMTNLGIPARSETMRML